MENKIGLLGSIMIVIANMVGVGIFTSLGFQLIELSDYRVILLLWVLGGFLALTGTFCYSELSAAFPRSGGEYHFLNISMGKLTGFLSAWTSMLVGFAAPIAAAAHAFSKYIDVATDFEISPLAIGAFIIIIVSIIQSINLNVGNKFQIYFTIGKLLLIFIFILGGFYCLNIQFTTSSSSFLTTGNFLEELMSPGFWIGSIFVSYAYSGWNATCYIIDDIKNPQKNVVRSTVFGTIIVTILYCCLTYVFLASTPASEMIGKEEIGFISASNLFGSNFGVIVSSLIAFFLVSSISAMTIVGPRVIKRVANDYNFFQILNNDSADKPPRIAIAIQTIIALFILLTSSFDFIITSIGFLLSVFTTLTAFSVILLRIKQPNVNRPWKVPFYPITPILYCFFNFWVIYYIITNRPESALISSIFLCIGVVVFYIIKSRSKHMET